jgi:HK97 family phage major capsid protein
MAIPLNERSVQDTASVDPLVPLTIGDIILPLEKGLILNKVGCKIQTGMVGTWNFPVVAGVEATIEDENAEISDSVIDISKISPSPKRCALKIPVSNRAINQSSNAILDIVNTQIAAGLQRLLNKWMFSPTLVTGASNGCFVKDAPTYVAGSSFTYKDAIKLQGIVLATGVQMDGTAAYVCSASTLADLKSTPIASGSGLMIVQDGKIDGYPVFVTEYIGDGKLGFGIFNYEMVGQFGPMMLIVDRITGAAKNLTYFILNVDFDMLSLRTEAFGVAQTATIPAIGVNKTSIATSAAAAATITEEVSVSGINLTAAIAAAITGTNSALFTVAPATIAKNSDGSAFAKLVITYAPTAVGSHSATLALSTTGGTTVNIALAGTCA